MNTALDINLFIQALLVNGIIAVLAYFAKAVSKSGILGGLIVGIPIYTFMGWQGFVILFSFFLIGTLATKWGYQKKKEMGLAEKNEGQRGISNVLAKCLAGVIFACLILLFKDKRLIFFSTIAFVGSFAAGTFDTVSSELGQLYGKRCFTIIPLREVSRGTEGAISYIGTLTGILGALLISLIYFTCFFLFINNYPISISHSSIAIYFSVTVILGALLSNLLESILGSLLESKGKINKFITNFLNTLFGGIFSFLFFFIFYPLLYWIFAGVNFIN